MWIAGLTALHKPFAHLHTQFNRDIPWATIDMDFMNLNQAAHGDREFGFICSRLRLDRKVVVGHWQDEDVHANLGVWCARRCAWPTPGREFARFGDNMREVAVTEGDKVEAQMPFGYSVNGYGVGDLVATHRARERRRGRPSACRRTTRAYERRQVSQGPDGAGASLREARGSSWACGAFLEEGGFKGFTDTFEDLHGLEQLPGHRLAAADGRRLRLRRRRRLEDRRAGPRDEGDGAPACRAARLSWRTTPTTSTRRVEGARRPHAGDLPAIARRADARNPSARHRRQGRPGAAGLRPPARSGDQRLGGGHGQPLPA